MRLPYGALVRPAVSRFLRDHGLSLRPMDGTERPPAGSAALGPGDVGRLLGELFEAQGRRCEAYARFRRAFDQLLRDGDSAAYGRVVAAVGVSFSAESGTVNGAGAALRAAGRPDLCAAVEALQRGEKAQLQFEATLQVLRKERAAGRWSWQQPAPLPGDHPAAAAAGGEPAATSGPLRPPWATGGGGCAQPQHGAAGGAGCGCAPAEPTQAEFEGAFGEATRALEAAVREINAALDELRAAAQDEADDNGGGD